MLQLLQEAQSYVLDLEKLERWGQWRVLMLTDKVNFEMQQADIRVPDEKVSKINSVHWKWGESLSQGKKLLGRGTGLRAKISRKSTNMFRSQQKVPVIFCWGPV